MTAKYPVELSDQEGIVDAVNYLLSGPSGLGQNFDGFSDYNPAIIRPTFFRPFTLPFDTTLDPSWYLRLTATAAAPTPSNPTQYITVDFTPPVAYTNPPFQFGDRLTLTGFVSASLYTKTNASLDTPTGTKVAVAVPGITYGPLTTTTVTGTGSGAKIYVTLQPGVSEPYSSANTATRVDIFNVGDGYVIGDTIKVLGTALGGISPANDLTLTVYDVDTGFWNDNYNVYSSTTTSVTFATTGIYNWPTVTTPGEIIRDYSNYPVSTDCLAQATINSATDRVFITAQAEFTATVNNETVPPLPAYYTGSAYDIVVQVNRYTASLDAQSNTVFNYQDTVSQKIFSTFQFDPTYTDGFSAIFTTIIDKLLQFGSYAYILEISFVTKPKLSDGTTPGTSGFGSTPGWLTDYGFKTSPLPRGVAVGNLQPQFVSSGTTYTGIVPQVLTGIGSNPLLDVTVYPNALQPLYVVGVSGSVPDGTVEITLNTTSGSNNLDFKPGDQLKIDGADIGGSSGLNDLYFTVTETDLRSTVIPGTFIMGLRNLTTQVIKE